jgi:hypothetical protein
MGPGTTDSRKKPEVVKSRVRLPLMLATRTSITEDKLVPRYEWRKVRPGKKSQG